jgi:hypothetical protein
VANLVAALYVDPRGPYPLIDGVDCWGIDRDATLYDGQLPIVAHPACGPWGALRLQYKGSEGGPELALRAVEQVRRWGGVLEHPIASRLWDACGLPKAGAAPDAFGGYTVHVNQSDWGHVCRKPSKLYCVRVPLDAHVTPTYLGADPVAWIGGGRKRGRIRPVDGRVRTHMPDHIRFASKAERILTPLEFAYHLCWLALRAS